MKRLVLTLTLVLITTTIIAQTENDMKTFDANFAHVVYFWFNDPDDKDGRQRFEASLKKFLSSSEYAKTNFVGTPPKATREVVDDSYTYNLIVTFESAEEQEAYQAEEAHLIFIEECKDLWKKVVVYDALGVEQ